MKHDISLANALRRIADNRISSYDGVNGAIRKYAPEYRAAYVLETMYQRYLIVATLGFMSGLGFAGMITVWVNI